MQIEIWFSVVYNLIDNDTVVKICCGLTRLRLMSPQHFDHSDDVY